MTHRAWMLGLALAALFPGAAGAVTLYGLVDTGELFTSADGGSSWLIQSALPVRDAVALAAGATATELLLASASGSLYRSTDAGLAWVALGVVPAADVAAMVPSPERILLITASGTVFASTDDGANFSVTGVIDATDVVSATRAATHDFALTRSGTVHRSTDGGATWTPLGALDVSDAVEIVALGADLYVLTSTGDLARSVDQGASWVVVSTLSQSGMSAMAVGDAELLASTRGGETAASATGMTWAWRGAIGQLEVRAIANDVPTTTGVEPASRRPLRFAAPWPNPASHSVTFAVDLVRASVVTLEVLDAAGRRVAVPIAGELLPAGRAVRSWRPGALQSGAYFARVRLNGHEQARGFVWLEDK
jgi:hypothetical protein